MRAYKKLFIPTLIIKNVITNVKIHNKNLIW